MIVGGPARSLRSTKFKIMNLIQNDGTKDLQISSYKITQKNGYVQVRKIPVCPHGCIDRNQTESDGKSLYLPQYLKNIDDVIKIIF